MASKQLNQLQSDLDTLKTALQADLPFTKTDAWLTLALAVAQIPSLGFVWLGGLGKESIPLWANALQYVVLAAIVIRSFRIEISTENMAMISKAGIRSGFVTLGSFFIFLLVAFVLHTWNEKSGLLLNETAGFSMMFLGMGIFGVVMGCMSKTTRLTLGFGMPLLLLGLAFPLIPKSLALGSAFSGIFASLLFVSIIMFYQLAKSNK